MIKFHTTNLKNSTYMLRCSTGSRCLSHCRTNELFTVIGKKMNQKRLFPSDSKEWPWTGMRGNTICVMFLMICWWTKEIETPLLLQICCCQATLKYSCCKQFTSSTIALRKAAVSCWKISTCKWISLDKLYETLSHMFNYHSLWTSSRNINSKKEN